MVNLMQLLLESRVLDKLTAIVRLITLLFIHINSHFFCENTIRQSVKFTASKKKIPLPDASTNESTTFKCSLCLLSVLHFIKECSIKISENQL